MKVCFLTFKTINLLYQCFIVWIELCPPTMTPTSPRNDLEKTNAGASLTWWHRQISLGMRPHAQSIYPSLYTHLLLNVRAWQGS